MAGSRPAVFGARLKQLRESRHVSLRDIADTTKIPVITLEALERDEISRLPGGIFSRSIVRAYAESIGADPERTVDEFMSRFPVEAVIDGSPEHNPSSLVSRRPSPLALLMILVPLVAILVWSLLA